MRPARIAAIISAIYLATIGISYFLQRDLLFYPNSLRIAPRALGLADVTELDLATADGEHLVAWYAPPTEGQPTLFYLHGNAGSLSHRAGRVRLFRGNGYGLFMLAYRGFSGSSGAPSEENMVADALMAYDRLKSLGASDKAIVVYGESLGTAVAVQVAANRQPGGLVLESPFSSAVDVGSYLYPFLPVHFLLRDRFESVKHIQKVKAPLLVLHGEDDRIVPARFGRKLFAAAPTPKTAYFFGGATHYTLYEHGAFEHIRSFVNGFATLHRLPGAITISCGAQC
jgi:fermentation-respiration switch protein FrsA (DUF1100 family)